MRPVAASRIVRRPAVPLAGRPAAGSGWFGWRQGLSRAERDQLQIRIATLTLSGVLVLVLLLVGGLLLWDKVILPLRPVLRADGRVTTLREYTDLLVYKQNELFAEYRQAEALASQPSGTDSGNDFMAQFARQRMQQVQMKLTGLNHTLLDDIVDDQLIRTEASRRALTASPDEIDKELKQLIGYVDPSATPAATAQETPDSTPAAAEATAIVPAAQPTSAAVASPTPRSRRPNSFEQQLRDYLRVTAGTEPIIRQDVETQILRRKLNDQLSASVASSAEQVHARHILVPDETAARAILERLRNGESFEALAADLSNDTSNKDKGGDLGWFPRGAMVSEFEAAAFALQPGQISEPVKTSFGVHIIELLERDAQRELEPQTLDSLKSSALTKWLEAEKKSHKIERLLTQQQIDWAAQNGRTPRAPSRR